MARIGLFFGGVAFTMLGAMGLFQWYWKFKSDRFMNKSEMEARTLSSLRKKQRELEENQK